MRSNGAVHIGNDSFLAVTRDVADTISLFASSFPAEEQVAPLRLSRQARFHPHADLACSTAELRLYDEANGSQDGSADTASSTGKTTAAPGFRHSLHTSCDGNKIAAISNTRGHHYIIDITVEPAAVCELEMPEVVRSVCWHPTALHTLIVLFASGNLSTYDTTRSMYGVVLALNRHIAIRPAIQRCLVDAEAHAKQQAASTASDTPKAEDSKATADADSRSGSRTPPRRSTAALVASRSPSIFPAADATPKSAASGSPDGAKPLSTGLHTGERATLAPSSPPSVDQLRTSQLDLVHIFALPATESTPVMLLVLSSSGDVYAVHFSDAALPVAATAEVTDDGHLRTLAEEEARLADAAASPLSLEVHHVIHGEDGADEALAVGGCRVDADAGTHAIFFCTANGFVKGAWVSEPDLLARHRSAHVRAVEAPNLSFTLQLSGPLALRSSLSPAVPSTTHGVGFAMTGNICILRTGASGRRTYMIAFPLWDRQQQEWVCWRPAGVTGRDRAGEEGAALPLLSTDAAVPPPVALRLPYDTQDASVALGNTEVLLVPELDAVDVPCARRSILSASIASLLRSALYARCGTLQPQPLCGGADGTAPLSTPPLALTDLLDTLPVCHRDWLSGAPPAEVNAVTLDLARRVESVTEDIRQRETAVQQRSRTLADKLTRLTGSARDIGNTLTKRHQIILDAIVHRRGGDAVRTANERLGKVFVLLNELEQL